MYTYSYDIFDTCLLRICGKQDFVFEQLALEIIGLNANESMVRDFVLARKLGEQKARKEIANKSIEDVTIFNIYEHCDFSSICNYQKQEILEKELHLHKEFLIPMHSTLEEIQKLHRQGHHIIFISDMYIGSQYLADILQEKGFLEEGDLVFVSCEIGLTKKTGNLYDYIKKKLNISYKRWIHKGDNYYSDYLVAKQKGINAVIVSSNYSYYEEKTIECDFSGAELDLFKLASIERGVRLTLPDVPENRFAADFIAPIYVPFVYHILQDAQKHHRTLFFVARDGYILYLIAKQFCHLFPNVKLRYLYASRKSLYLPGITELSIEGIMEAVPYKGDVNIDDILSILHLRDFPIDKSIFVGLTPKAIITKLLENNLFLQELTKVYTTQSEYCFQYFCEQGLTTPGSAIVDVFGTRKCQKFINNILERHGHCKIYGYYYEVLTERISDSSEFYALHYQEQLKFSIHDTYLSQKQQLFEQYFSITPYERTGGYSKMSNGQIEPFFDKDIIDKQFKENVFNANKLTCILFASFFLKLHFHSHENCSRAAQAVFNHFFQVPRKEYLTALEGFCESDDHYSQKILTKRNLIGVILGKDRFLSWMAGNAVFNSGILYRIIRWGLFYRWRKENKKKFSLT